MKNYILFMFSCFTRINFILYPSFYSDLGYLSRKASWLIMCYNDLPYPPPLITLH